jgi:uncharacterized membrane protein
MKDVYRSLVIAVVFGNAIAFPIIAYNFPWDTYLIDPTPYYIIQSESLGLLIAACVFIYEWVKYADHRIFKNFISKISSVKKKG